MGKALLSLRTRTYEIETGIKLIIFDFDGTLCDSLSWFSGAINDAARRYNFKVTTEAEMQMLRNLNTREIIAYLEIPWWKVPFIARFMRSHMNREISTISSFPDVDVFLPLLKERGYDLALVTSNSRENVSSVLGKAVLSSFTYVECGTSVFGKSKRFKKIIRSSKLKGPEILSIGDEMRDIEAAKKLGIKSAAVTWGYAKESALKAAAPEFLFTSTRDLCSVML